jgi:hypothetical protein
LEFSNRLTTVKAAADGHLSSLKTDSSSNDFSGCGMPLALLQASSQPRHPTQAVKSVSMP